MTLRRKLLITFGTLALLGLVVAGVSVWATLQWESSSEQLQRHYTRSLEAQQVRAATFRALKEVSDVIAEGDSDARQEFERAIESVERDLGAWADLADTEEERLQVEEVRSAYESVVVDANRVFDLVEAGSREEAISLAEEQLESGTNGSQENAPPPEQPDDEQDEGDARHIEPDDDDLYDEESDDLFEKPDDDLEGSNREGGRYELVSFVQDQSSFEDFEAATDRAVASDEEAREGILAQTEDARRTAQLVLIVAAFGVISLLLLLAAYLASDLFRPLRGLRQALEDVEKGDLNRRIEEDRADELGEVNRAFNRMVEAVAQREQMEELAAVPSSGREDENGLSWRNMPSRITLHRLVSQLRSRISQLHEAENGRDGYAGEQKELVGQLDRLSQAVARMTEFGFPLDLNLSRADVRTLLYRVFMRFQDEFAERAVSIELRIAPEVGYAVVDRLKLREAVGELLSNALSALPETGGQLGLRSRLSEDGTELLIEVADDGAGAEQSFIDAAFDPPGDAGEPRVGLALTRAIVEQHGGHLEIESEPGDGTYAQIRLPLRD